MEQKIKILLVEDEQLLRQGFESLGDWNREGFLMMHGVSNGQEALESIQKMPPDIVITDIVMPVMNGLELIRILHQQYPQIKVIVLSNYDTFDYVREAMQLGATDYFLKSRVDFAGVMKCLKKIRADLLLHKGNNFLDAGDELEKAVIFRDLLHGQSNHSTFLSQLDDNRIGVYILHFFAPPEQFSPEMLLSHTAAALAGFPCIVGMDHKQNIVFLTKERTEQAVQFFELLQRTFSDTDLLFCLSCDTSAQKISDIPSSYQAAESKLPFCFYFENSCLFMSSTPLPRGNLKIDMEQVQSAIDRCDYASLRKISEDFLQQASRAPYADPYELLKASELIINLLFLQRTKLRPTSAQEKHQKLLYFKELGTCRQFKHFCATYNAILDEIILEQIPATHPIIHDLLCFLETNPTSETTLRSVAQQFNINYSYLSQLFTNTLHTSFTKYVTQLKIRKAIALLQSGNYSVSQVCEELRFSDVSYFCKVFKKETGYTPSTFLPHTGHAIKEK